MSSSVTSKYSTATTTTVSSSVSSSSSLSYPKTKIVIFNLPYDTMELELTEHCCQFGLIHNVVIPKDADGISRGFGFVTFDNEEDASYALQALNGYPMNQRTLRADWSKDQPKPRCQRVIITTRGGPPKRR